ncbi:MAG: YHS domain-containing protein [Candidatus Bipolaricaulia bacterium]
MKKTIFKDPVCGKRVNRQKAHIAVDYEGYTYYLCCPRCQQEFESDPAKYASRELGHKIPKEGHQKEGRQIRRS